MKVKLRLFALIIRVTVRERIMETRDVCEMIANGGGDEAIRRVMASVH